MTTSCCALPAAWWKLLAAPSVRVTGQKTPLPGIPWDLGLLGYPGPDCLAEVMGTCSQDPLWRADIVVSVLIFATNLDVSSEQEVHQCAWHIEWAYEGSAACRKRVFVLSCFLADDSLAVFEPVVKNSGIIGGKYLERRQVGAFRVAWHQESRSIN